MVLRFPYDENKMKELMSYNRRFVNQDKLEEILYSGYAKRINNAWHHYDSKLKKYVITYKIQLRGVEISVTVPQDSEEYNELGELYRNRRHMDESEFRLKDCEKQYVLVNKLSDWKNKKNEEMKDLYIGDY
ncbi:MAG: hypothetical protein ACLSVX_02705 [Massilimicrobiota timonensis]